MIWRKSSYSAPNNDCVEVAEVGVGVMIRNSKAPERGILAFSSAAVTEFVAACRGGELDDLGA